MKVYRPTQQSHLFLIRHNIRFLNKGLRATWLIGLRCLVDPGLNISSRVQVATMVIALPLPTLQTRATEPLSSTRRGITPMGITRGYERSIDTVVPVYLLWSQVESKVFVFLCRMVTNRTINEVLVRDPEECREAALRQSDPEKAFS